MPQPKAKSAAFLARIELILREQRRYMESQKKIRGQVGDLQRRLNHRFWQLAKEMLGIDRPESEFHRPACCEGGSLSSSWKPSWFIHALGDFSHYQGKWYRFVPDGKGDYHYVEEQPPWTRRQVRDFLQRLTDETGIKARLYDDVGVQYQLHPVEHDDEED